MTAEQQERLDWLEHILSDPDAGRLMPRVKLYQLNEEREFLKELSQQKSQSLASDQ